MDSRRVTTDFPNKTVKFFYRLCLICYCSGLPNFWMEPLPFPKRIHGAYRVYSRLITLLVYVFIVSEWTSMLSQRNLTEKQASDQMVYMMSHPMLWSYSVIFARHTDKVRKILADIMRLKEVYNDLKVEKKMMRKSKFYSSAFCGMCTVSMMMYTIDSLVQCVRKGKTFNTVITVWPLVEDSSVPANAVRFLWNLLWWWMMARVLSVYAFVFSLTSCMSHQFIDLQSYFLSLDRIFQDNLSQRRMERTFEDAYKIGIQLHYDTLECVELSKSICGWLFSGQIIFNMTMLVLLMAQMLNAERTLMHVGAIAIAAFCIVLGTGLFMCNAGDVTVEASELSTAMYSSGWHYCRGPSSVRIRKLVITSMVYAQRPVVIKGLGILSLSYQSYVSLVKSTYSVFSLVFQKTKKI